MRGRDGEPLQKSWNRAYLRGFCIGLGKHLGWNLNDELQQQLFLHEYQQRVWVGELPDSPEWRREVFREDESRGAESEECRRLGIAMWYLSGKWRAMRIQDELRVLIINLYEDSHKCTRQLETELDLARRRQWTLRG